MAPSALETNRPIVISGPSGAGKSTILNRLFAEFPDKFGFSVSHTTRNPRAGEQNGREYHFISKDEFAKLVEDGKFIEHAEFGSNCYGTSVMAVDDVAEKGRICILDIEMEGVKQVASPESKLRSRPRFLFLSPPSLEILEQRLRGRATDSEDAILKRLAQAEIEMSFARDGGIHEKVVVNDDLDEAYTQVRSFIMDE